MHWSADYTIDSVMLHSVAGDMWSTVGDRCAGAKNKEHQDGLRSNQHTVCKITMTVYMLMLFVKPFVVQYTLAVTLQSICEHYIET